MLDWQTKKPKGQVLTVHNEAALRLGGRGGHLVGVRYGVVCEGSDVELRPWTNSRAAAGAPPSGRPAATNQRPALLMTTAFSTVRRATSQEESPASLSVVSLAPHPLLHLLRCCCLPSALAFRLVCSADPVLCSTSRLLLAHSKAKIHPANTAFRHALKPRLDAVYHHHHLHHVGQAHPVC